MVPESRTGAAADGAIVSPVAAPLSLGERFGLRTFRQVAADYAEMVRDGLRGTRFQLSPSSVGLVRPELSIPAYRGRVPADGLAPIYNLFDRHGGGQHYSQRVSRRRCRDYRGGKLSYDEHDGTDLVCPVGTPLCAAAPGAVVMIRDRWLRGGLTVALDHGHAVLTQYCHCSRALVHVGQRVVRGQPVALSGASGVDVFTFFPWVPPHVHFLVMVRGRPVDPFRAVGEGPRLGLWWHGRCPRPTGPLPNDSSAPRLSEVDQAALDSIAEACTDPVIRNECARVVSDPPALAALLEDALFHDGWAWPARYARASVRPERPVSADAVRLTLPLPATDYRGARFADMPWTAPPLG